MPGAHIKYDDPAIDLFRSFWDITEDQQNAMNNQAERDYHQFQGFVDMTNRNPGRANVSIPKLNNVVRTKAPVEAKAIIGQTPYFPIGVEREEFEEQAELITDVLSFYTKKGVFPMSFLLADVMKIIFGTSYIEVMPKLCTISQKIAIPQYADTINGAIQVGFLHKRVKVERMRLKFRALAPWQVRVDPLATDLETKEGCRGLIKINICRKTDIIEMAEKGDFGKDFDVDKLKKQDYSDYQPDRNRGAQILSAMGYPEPDPDGEIGVWYQYESPDRYFDIWNDEIIMRDRDNPFSVDEGGHGLCNLSRLVHYIEPHTGRQFYGNGDGKLIEPLSNLLNDLFNIALDNHMMLNQGKTYYAKDRGVVATQLVHAIGNKIGFKLSPGEKIQDVVRDDYGQSLPSDHYNMISIAENYIDLSAKSNPVSRGESAPGDQTLGEVGLLKEADEAGVEWNVKILEDITMTDIANKACCHIEQFATKDDIIEAIGMKKAEILLYKNPNDLPGGFNYEFAGSDMIINKAIRQRNIVNLDTRIGQSQYIYQNEWQKELVKAHDLGDIIDKIFKPDEVIAEEQRQAMLQQMAESGASPRVLDQKKQNPQNTDIGQERAKPMRIPQ